MRCLSISVSFSYGLIDQFLFLLTTINLFQYVDDNLSLMSVGFLLSKADEAVIWRGPKKNGIAIACLVINGVKVIFKDHAVIVLIDLRNC